MACANLDPALTVAMSNLIIKEIDLKYPIISKLLAYNRPVMLHMMKALGALAGGRINQPLKCKHSGSGLGYKVWEQYGKEIHKYVDELCSKLYMNNLPLREILYEARKFLSDHIHEEYYNLLPKWPSDGETNYASFSVNIKNSYTSGVYFVVWSCYGIISVQDMTEWENGKRVYTAYFYGEPEIKLLLLNHDIMLDFEKICERKGIEGFMKVIDSTAVELGPSELEIKFDKLFLKN